MKRRCEVGASCMELLRIKQSLAGYVCIGGTCSSLNRRGGILRLPTLRSRPVKGNPDLSIGIYNRVIHISLLQNGIFGILFDDIRAIHQFLSPRPPCA